MLCNGRYPSITNSILRMDEMFTQKNAIEKFDADLYTLLELAAMPKGSAEIKEVEEPGDDLLNNIINYSKALSVRKSKMMDKMSFVLN